MDNNIEENSKLDKHPFLYDTSLKTSRYIETLQKNYLSQMSSASGLMAKLRRARGKELDEEESAWDEVLKILGNNIPRGDAPLSKDEKAVNTAITLYAFYQKNSSIRAVHVRGVSLGKAVGLFMYHNRKEENKVENVLRVFNLVRNAKTFKELSYQLGRLLALLDNEPFDFGLLTNDLLNLQTKNKRKVLMSWSRDLHRALNPPKENNDKENNNHA